MSSTCARCSSRSRIAAASTSPPHAKTMRSEDLNRRRQLVTARKSGCRLTRNVPRRLTGRIAGGERGGNGRAFLVGLEGPGLITGRQLHIANFGEKDREVHLPLGVGRIGGGDLAGDGQALLVGLEGPGLVAGGPPHIADLVEAEREVHLPLGVG